MKICDLHSNALNDRRHFIVLKYNFMMILDKFYDQDYKILSLAYILI